MVTEKLFGEMKEKSLIQPPFSLYEISFVNGKTEVETVTRNYKMLTAMTHSDVGDCEDHFKTTDQAYAISKDKKARQLYETLRLQKVEELSRTTGLINQVV